MSIRIAIPEPTGFDQAYNQRALPLYLHALISSGAVPVVVPLHESQSRVANLLGTVNGILLPGSKADLDPQKYGQEPIPATAAPDPARAAVDELLLQDAFNLYKPILAICQGTQSLNVWKNGTLIQDIPTQTSSRVNHRPGREVIEAHPVSLIPGTQLAAIAAQHPEELEGDTAVVNSSHHQAIGKVGDNLIVSARSTGDNLIEAVELDSPDHFVLAVQWHPERTYDSSYLSRSLFSAFVHHAAQYEPRKILESVGVTRG